MKINKILCKVLSVTLLFSALPNITFAENTMQSIEAYIEGNAVVGEEATSTLICDGDNQYNEYIWYSAENATVDGEEAGIKTGDDAFAYRVFHNDASGSRANQGINVALPSEYVDGDKTFYFTFDMRCPSVGDKPIIFRLNDTKANAGAIELGVIQKSGVAAETQFKSYLLKAEYNDDNTYAVTLKKGDKEIGTNPSVPKEKLKYIQFYCEKVYPKYNHELLFDNLKVSDMPFAEEPDGEDGEDDNEQDEPTTPSEFTMDFTGFASNIAAIDGLANADGETRGNLNSYQDNGYGNGKFGFSTNATTVGGKAYFFVKDDALGFRQYLPTGTATAYNQRMTVALPTDLASAGKDFLIDFKMKAWPQGYNLNLRFNSVKNGNSSTHTELGTIVRQGTKENSLLNYSIKVENIDKNNCSVSLYKNEEQIGQTQQIAKAKLKYLEFFWAAAYADRTYELLIDDIKVYVAEENTPALLSLDENDTQVVTVSETVQSEESARDDITLDFNGFGNNIVTLSSGTPSVPTSDTVIGSQSNNPIAAVKVGGSLKSSADDAYNGFGFSKIEGIAGSAATAYFFVTERIPGNKITITEDMADKYLICEIEHRCSKHTDGIIVHTIPFGKVYAANSGIVKADVVKVLGAPERKYTDVLKGVYTYINSTSGSPDEAGTLYQWYRSSDNNTYTPISGADSKTYTVKVEDEKCYLKFGVKVSGAADYVKSDNYIKVSELPVTNREGNEAFGKSVVDETEENGTLKAYAFDGKQDKAWIPAGATPSVIINLGGTPDISELVIEYDNGENELNTISDIAIYASDDAAVWGDAIEQTGTSESTADDNYKFPYKKINFNAVNKKYIKLTFQKSGTVKLNEIELYFADADKAKYAANCLTVPSTALTADLVLPAKGAYNSTIVWKSGNTSIISDDGNIFPSSAGELSTTLTATVTVRNAPSATKTFSVTVAQQTGGGNGGGTGGNSGSGGTGGNKLSGTSVVIGGAGGTTAGENSPSASTPATSFSDISSVPWAAQYIEELAKRGIVSGMGDGKYAPESPVTREQLVKMVVEGLGIKEDNTETGFADVSPDSWYASYIAAAVKHGIINGISNTDFGVSDNISRQDMCVILYRVIKIAKIELTENAASNEFADSISISPYAVDAVNCLKTLGIVDGMGNNTFMPKEAVTRAQMAKVLCLVLEQVGR